MNKKSLRIAGWALGLSMAVAGIGAVAARAVFANNEVVVAHAVAGEEHDLGGASFSQLLNNNATIAPVNITDPGYYFNKITVNARYSKSLNPGVTITATVGGKVMGSVGVYGTDKAYEDFEISSADPVKGDIVLTFVNHSGSGTGKGTFYVDSVSATECEAPAASKPITSFSDVVLSASSVPANYTKPLTASVEFSPADTDDLVSWTSSDETVATIATTADNGVAAITVVGEGTCTFTASNSAGDVTKESGTFTVTAAEVIRAYNVTFAGTGTASDGTAALNAAGVSEQMLGDGSAVTVGSTANVFKGGDSSLKFSSAKNAGSLQISKVGEDTGDDLKMVIVSAKAFGSDSSSLSVKIGSNTAKSTGTLTADYKYYVLPFDAAGKSVTLTATSRLYLKDLILVRDGEIGAQGAYSFAAQLLNDTAAGCAGLDAAKLTTAWGSLATAFATAETNYVGSNAFFKNAIAYEDGNVLEKGVARYDYIVGKYLKTLGNESFADFADRNPAPVQAAHWSFSPAASGTSAITIAAVVAGVGALVAGSLFLFRKKKEN